MKRNSDDICQVISHRKLKYPCSCAVAILHDAFCKFIDYDSASIVSLL
jgi:hypothetical protein